MWPWTVKILLRWCPCGCSTRKRTGVTTNLRVRQRVGEVERARGTERGTRRKAQACPHRLGAIVERHAGAVFGVLQICSQWNRGPVAEPEVYVVLEKHDEVPECVPGAWRVDGGRGARARVQSPGGTLRLDDQGSHRAFVAMLDRV